MQTLIYRKHGAWGSEAETCVLQSSTPESIFFILISEKTCGSILMKYRATVWTTTTMVTLTMSMVLILFLMMAIRSTIKDTEPM